MKSKYTYHWVIVLSCFLMMAASIGVMINCFNLFTIEWMAEFGYSASSVQLVITIVTLANLVGGALVGKVMEKFSMRVTMPIYALVMLVGFYLYSLCNSLTSFYLVSLLVGFGASGVSLIPCGALINNWFEEKKGMATGIAFTGSVAGGLFFVQITKVIIATQGWRMAYVVLSILAAVMLLPTTLFLVHEYPADKGLLPLGQTENDTQLKGIELKQYIKTASFWLLALSFFIIGFANMGLQNNLSIYLTRIKGYTEIVAANIFSIALFVQIFGKVLLGAIYDKKGVRFGAIYCAILYILVIVTLMMSGQMVFAIVFSVLFGLVSSMTTVTPPYIAATIVGVRDYSTIYGVLSLFYGLGVATGPVVAGKIFDTTGSYNPAWIAFTILSLFMAITTVLSVKKGKGFANISDSTLTTTFLANEKQV